MEYVRLIIAVLLVAKSRAEEDEEVCCGSRFVDALRSCPDFDNDAINADSLLLGLQGEEEANGLRVSGAINLGIDIDDEFEVELTVSKLTDLGKEYMYGAAMGVCASLKSEDAPWTPLFEAINITTCPIVQSNYLISEVVLNLNFAKDLMRHEFCGEYEIELSFLNTLAKTSCHIITLEIYEKYKK